MNNQLLISAADGIWSGPLDGSASFKKIQPPVPIFVMGATVMECQSDGHYLLGSFNGLYEFDPKTNTAVDVFTQRAPTEISNVKPAGYMVTGVIATPNGQQYLATHEQGLLTLPDLESPSLFSMPVDVSIQYRMPLWNYLFEIHNGRFFRGLLGEFYILLVPLGALSFILITLSGVLDWIFLYSIRKKGLSA